MRLKNTYKAIFHPHSFFIWILLASLLPAIAISLFAIPISENALKQEVVSNLSAIANDKIIQMDHFIQGIKAETELLTQAPSLSPIISSLKVTGSQNQAGSYTPPTEQTKDFFKRILEYRKLNDIMIVAATGNVIFSLKQPQLIGQNILDPTYATSQLGLAFKNATTMLETHVSDFEETSSTKRNSMLYVASPLFSETELVGALVTSVDNKGLTEIASYTTGLGETGETIAGKYINGKIIPEINLRHATIKEFMSHSSQMDNRMLKAFEDAAIKASKKGEGIMVDYRGKEVLGVWRFLPALNWGVLVKIDTDEAFSPVYILKNNLIFISLIIFLIALFVSYLVGHRFQKTESNLLKVLDELETARDRALESDRSKSLFLANISYELRTPLNTIIGYSEMMHDVAQMKGLTNFVIDLSRINSAGKHLLSLINDILDLSKIEGRKMDLYLEEVDLFDLVNNINTLVKPLIDKGNNTLKIECDHDIGRWKTDVTKIRQCFINLIGNANKFTDNGTITVRVERLHKKEKEWIQIQVKDTGAGISPNQKQKLFELFSQHEFSTSRQGVTGLGLLITKNFCQLLGGHIEVESSLNKGSTFTMMIPAVLPPQENTQKEHTLYSDNLSRDFTSPPTQEGINDKMSDTSQETLKSDSIKVLIIDDDPTTHTHLAQHMMADGFQLFHAYNSEKGLELCKTHKPDIIVLGVILPKMDGWEILSSLKADPAFKDIKVVMTSTSDEKEIALALGAAEFVTKPFKSKDLVEKLQRHVSGQSSPILIIEDDLTARNLIARSIKDNYRYIEEASNGHEALEKIEHTTPSIILLDLMMPEMDGFEFLNRLRMNEKWKQIPVIVITAKDLSSADRARLGSVDAVFSKGEYHQRDLLDAVQRKIGDIEK